MSEWLMLTMYRKSIVIIKYDGVNEKSQYFMYNGAPNMNKGFKNSGAIYHTSYW